MYTQASANSLVWKKAMAAQKQTSLGTMPGDHARHRNVACSRQDCSIYSAVPDKDLANLVQLFPATAMESLARVAARSIQKNS
jgi:hypothetical protein